MQQGQRSDQESEDAFVDSFFLPGGLLDPLEEGKTDDSDNVATRSLQPFLLPTFARSNPWNEGTRQCSDGIPKPLGLALKASPSHPSCLSDRDALNEEILLREMHLSNPSVARDEAHASFQGSGLLDELNTSSGVVGVHDRDSSTKETSPAPSETANSKRVAKPTTWRDLVAFSPSAKHMNAAVATPSPVRPSVPHQQQHPTATTAFTTTANMATHPARMPQELSMKAASSRHATPAVRKTAPSTQITTQKSHKVNAKVAARGAARKVHERSQVVARGSAYTELSEDDETESEQASEEERSNHTDSRGTQDDRTVDEDDDDDAESEEFEEFQGPSHMLGRDDPSDADEHRSITSDTSSLLDTPSVTQRPPAAAMKAKVEAAKRHRGSSSAGQSSGQPTNATQDRRPSTVAKSRVSATTPLPRLQTRKHPTTQRHDGPRKDRGGTPSTSGQPRSKASVSVRSRAASNSSLPEWDNQAGNLLVDLYEVIMPWMVMTVRGLLAIITVTVKTLVVLLMGPYKLTQYFTDQLQHDNLTYLLPYVLPYLTEVLMYTLILPPMTPHVIAYLVMYFLAQVPTDVEAPTYDAAVSRESALRWVRLSLSVMFCYDGFWNSQSSVMMLQGPDRLIMAYALTVIKLGLHLSPVAWISGAVQVLIAISTETAMVALALDYVLVAIGLASIRLVSELHEEGNGDMSMGSGKKSN